MVVNFVMITDEIYTTRETENQTGRTLTIDSSFVNIPSLRTGTLFFVVAGIYMKINYIIPPTLTKYILFLERYHNCY